jgi:hypothetical protein
MSNYFKKDYAKVYEEHAKSMNEKKSGTSQGVDLTNYFSIYLPKDGEDTVTKIIRIVPPADGMKLWDEVWYHDGIKVYNNKPKLYDPHMNDGEPSPLFEMYNSIKESKTLDEETKKQEAAMYFPRLFYIFRVIERGKEEEGVKFWRFKKDLRKEGIMDKLEALFRRNPNWADPINGIDIEITISKIISKSNPNSYYCKVISVAKAEECPLHESEEKMVEWIEDERTYKDVYKVYPFEYLELVAQGKLPKWDEKSGKYIEVEELDTSEETDTIDNVDGSSYVPEDEISETTEETNIVEENEVAAEDLPF